MVHQLGLFYTSIVIFFISIISFIYFRKFAKIINLIDHPSNDNIHTRPIVTSGGIVFVTLLSITLILFYIINDNFLQFLPNNYFILWSSIVTLSAISFYDDLKKIHPSIRLVVQISVTMICMSALNLSNFFLPLKLTIFLFVYFWVYLINIINFTDGSDGFLTTNSIVFFLTIIIFQLNSQITISLYLASFILPMLLAFIIFNKPPAKIFMGDTGSVLLGFLIGYISLEFIINGHINLIVSLLAYTILDCTMTLIIKTMKGNYPWARMFDYYFLIPIKNNKKHFRTFYANLIYNFLNLIIIIIQILYDIELLCIASIGMSLILIRYYKNTK